MGMGGGGGTLMRLLSVKSLALLLLVIKEGLCPLELRVLLDQDILELKKEE